MSALRAKLFPSLHRYEHKWLRPDLIAALTLWAVLVPEALAYAAIAGVSPVVGLYAVPGALILYAALGSSRELVVGPSAAAAALSAATVGEVAAGGSEEFVQLTVALALCVGAAALIAGLLRLGFVANLISVPVFRGSSSAWRSPSLSARCRRCSGSTMEAATSSRSSPTSSPTSAPSTP